MENISHIHQNVCWVRSFIEPIEAPFIRRIFIDTSHVLRRIFNEFWADEWMSKTRRSGAVCGRFADIDSSVYCDKLSIDNGAVK